MANLPDGISSLGPIYIPTETKEDYIAACDAEGISRTDKMKLDIKKFILKHFPGKDVKV